MKHSAMNRRLLLEWLCDCDDAGEPMPTDAQIRERFRFTSEEQARGLLADLAEAKLVVVTGVGRSRSIALPGAKPIRPTMLTPEDRGRLPATIKRADPGVERVTALIVDLNARAGRIAQPATPEPALPPARMRQALPVTKEKTMEKQPAAQAAPALTIDDLAREAQQLVMKIERFKIGQQAKPVQRPEDAATIAALIERAEAAEGKLATLRAALAA